MIHSFAIPGAGVKMMLPGRINTINMLIERESVLLGGCYELCGVNHGLMPIVGVSLNKDVYNIIFSADIKFKFRHMINDAVTINSEERDQEQYEITVRNKFKSPKRGSIKFYDPEDLAYLWRINKIRNRIDTHGEAIHKRYMSIHHFIEEIHQDNLIAGLIKFVKSQKFVQLFNYYNRVFEIWEGKKLPHNTR